MTVGIDLDCREGIRAAGSVEFEGWIVGYQKLRLARDSANCAVKLAGSFEEPSRQEPASAYRATIYGAVRGAPTLFGAPTSSRCLS